MMAYDKDGKMSDSMWGVLAVAKALKTFSRYPLLLLTNTTEFPDGTDVQAAFSQLNTVILPVLEVEMQGTQGWSLERWTFAFWKLQIWRLTDYDKLIWLDADALVYRSLDFIFDREWMWAQRDAWFCDLDAPKVCSGIMSVYPSEEDFEGLLKYAAKVGSSLTSGDQQLIEWYFRDVRNKPVHLLSPLEASFGQCSGTAISPYLTKEGMDVAGMWSVPAFIHKSGGYDNTVVNSYNNVCFTLDIARQRYYIGGRVINVCHFNPLAATWRKQFCAAVADLGLRVESATEFCDDQCYFLGERAGDDRCPSHGKYVSGGVDEHLDDADYRRIDARGLPGPLQLKASAPYQFDWGKSWGEPNRSIEYVNATLPRPPYTIMFNVKTMAPTACQEVIGWFGKNTSVEVQLRGGNLVYVEQPNSRTQVSTKKLTLADGASHSIVIMRQPSGEVLLLHGGKVVERGFVEAFFPDGLPSTPKSSRPLDCSLNGEVQGLKIFPFVLSAKQLEELYL